MFERFPSGRIPIIGPIGLMVHDWSKPVDGHPRLFDHSALELLTTAHPRVVVSVYSLLAVALLWSGVDAGLSASVVVRRAAAGIAVWTLTEYLMHRYACHFVPRTRTGVALPYLSHGVHHAYPRDPDRLVMPLIVSAPIAVMLLLAGRAKLPSGITCSARAAEANPHR